VKSVGLDVVGVGKSCVDLIVKVDHVPKSDESLPMQDFTMQGGGKVSTALVAAARLGTRAGFIGVVGNDTFGNFIIQDFTKHNIDISQVIKEEGKTSPFSVIVSDTEGQGRSIIWDNGTVSELKWDDINTAYLKKASFIHLAGSSQVEQQIARFAKQNGSKVVYDADFYEPTVEEILPWIDVLIPSQEFADAYWKGKLATAEDYIDVAKDLSKYGAEVVVITLGKKGAVGYYQGKSFFQEAFKVPVVDTTGAGDVFHGAFIAGLLQKQSYEECTRFATAVAALKTLALGGRAGIPTFRDVEKFLATGQGIVEDLQQRADAYKHALHYFSPGGL
jgi:sulfofructose kinase